MPEIAWRKTRFQDALDRDDLRQRARRALALEPLCDHCLGRLFANVGTGLANDERGRLVRKALAAKPPPPTCPLCGNIFDAVTDWVVRCRDALAGWQFETFAIASHADPDIASGEQALWAQVGDDLAEPYKQQFNRLVGTALANAIGREPDLVHADILVLADHATGEVTLRVEPLFVAGRYRKLARGMPQCRWREWPTSVQQIVGDPVLAAAEGEDHLFHGCGREDTDVRCLGERPFILEVARPRRRQIDWSALAAEVNGSGKVEVVDLAPTTRAEVARLKGLRPEKTYRALAELADEMDAARLAHLEELVGVIEQQTPTRVLRHRANRVRRRRVRSLTWQQTGPRTIELTVRAQAGTYIKELISGDDARTRPSVADVLATRAVCAQLDVLAIHLDD